MSGKTLLILVLLLLAGALVALAVVTQSGPPADIGSGGRAPVTKPEDEEVAELPPLRDRPAPSTGEVAGRVFGPDGGPLTGATVSLSVAATGEPRERTFNVRLGGGGMSASFDADFAAGRRSLGSAITKEDGTFSFTTSAAGPFMVRADHDGFGSAMKDEVKRGTRDLALKLAAAGAVRGVVRDDLGAAVPGAVVTADLARTITDEDGAFRLGNVNAGETVELLARANGYDDATLELALSPGVEQTLENPLVLTGHAGLTGRIFDPAGQPLQHALVRVASNPFEMNTDTTDEGGRYFLEVSGDGEVGLKVDHVEYLPAEVTGIRCGEDTRVVAPDVRLRPGGVIAGRVVDPDGQPVADARAVAMSASDEFDMEELMMRGMGESSLPGSDEDGHYRVPGLETGTYLLAVSAEGFRKFIMKEIAVQVPETTVVDVVLDPGLSLAGKVVDGAGVPLAGASIQAHRDDEPGNPDDLREAMLLGNWSAGAESSADGTFTVSGLSEGKVHLNVGKAGYSSEYLDGVEPGTKDLVITLELAGSISGLVVDGESGEPVAGAAVTANDGTSEHSTTDEEGRFSLDAVSPGDRTVSVNSEEHLPEQLDGVTVVSGSPTTGLTFRLRRGETLTGVVVRASDGGSVAGANVSADGPVSRSVECDPEGRFTVKGLMKGAYDLEASAEDLADTALEGVAVPSPGDIRIEMRLGGTVRGVVRDEHGKPLSGQMVMTGSGPNVFEKTVTTGADGAFLFKNLPAGRQTIMVMKLQSTGGFGFGANTKSVVVEEGREVFVEFGGAGAPKKTRLKGRLLDHGRPAGGRMLIFMKADIEGGMAELMTSFKMVTTSKDGDFDVADLESGPYRVFSGAMGMEMGTSMDLTITGDGGVLEQDLTLPDGVFAGTVVRADTGAAVPGAKLMLLDPRLIAEPATSLFDILGLMKGQFASGEGGAFEIDTAAKGPMLLQVLAPDLAPAVIDDLVITDQPGQPLRIALTKGFAVRVRVRDGAGEPVVGSPLIVFDGRGRRLLVLEDSLPHTDTNGQATITLPAGTWRILAQPDGLASALKAVSVQGSTEVDVTVSSGGTLVAVVTSAGGPVAGAVIRTFDEAGREVAHHLTQDGMMIGAPSRKTGDDGHHTREHVPVGTWRVTATAPDGRVGTGSARIIEGGTTELAIEIP